MINFLKKSNKKNEHYDIIARIIKVIKKISKKESSISIKNDGKESLKSFCMNQKHDKKLKKISEKINEQNTPVLLNILFEELLTCSKLFATHEKIKKTNTLENNIKEITISSNKF